MLLVIERTDHYGSMNLVVDWGNSRLKAGWFDTTELVRTDHFGTAEAMLQALTTPGSPQPDQVIVSSTSRSEASIRQELARLTDTLYVFDNRMPVPIQNGYETPQTLGADRLAAAVGATALFPDRACLVLDLGTCLTADLVDDTGTFRGGLIAPGLHMRFQAMHEHTARLPLIENPLADADWPALTARTTRDALRSGVLNGLGFELNGLIGAHRDVWPDLAVLLCGGDGPVLRSRLKEPIFAVPELVLIGLNRILRHNVENLRTGRPANWK
ncbi:type III pantothenate kinase [uncultured Spirosoma sp.]|uniref:type III pantothenate kinase n=1 Tax=uncultured Spirosoma sp. TaxID=278208 RepID=UPI00338F3ED1